jgi:pimeloyl-ACP methyl ester carboxylesterase
VSLSAEAALQGTAVAPYAAKLTAPALFVTATGDEYGAATATPGFEKAAPAKAKRLVVVPGTAHGTALLAQPAIARDVTQFLARYDR